MKAKTRTAIAAYHSLDRGFFMGNSPWMGRPGPPIGTSRHRAGLQLVAGLVRLWLWLPVCEQELQRIGQSLRPGTLGVLRIWFEHVAEGGVVVTGRAEVRDDLVEQREPVLSAFPFAQL